MTISSVTKSSTQYNGDDSTVAFSTSFVFDVEGSLDVYVDSTLQTITTHYTVSGGGTPPATGTVTMVTAPATGEVLTIQRVTPRTQGTDYVENDAFPAASHEAALDKTTLLIQEIEESLSRTVLQDVTTTITDLTLPAPVALEYLRWNAGGTDLENSAISAAGLADIVEDLTPQLGGNLDVNGKTIVSTSNADIVITPNGTGTVVIDADLDVDNLNLNGNTIISTDTNGDIVITPNGTGTVVIDADLDVDNININGNTIISTDTAGDINLTPDTTGDLVLDGLKWPQADGSSSQLLSTNGSGQLSFATAASGGESWEFIASSTVTTGTSEIAFTGLSGYDEYQIFVIDLTVETANATLGLVYAVSGVSYFTDGYDYSRITTSLSNATNQASVLIGTQNVSGHHHSIIHILDGTSSSVPCVSAKTPSSNDQPVATALYSTLIQGLSTDGSTDRSGSITAVKLVASASDTFDGGVITILGRNFATS